MRILGVILLTWSVGTLVTYGQVPQPGQALPPIQPVQAAQNPFPTQPMVQPGVGQPVRQPGFGQPGAGQPLQPIQPVQGLGQPGTGVQPATGQPGAGQPKVVMPQPVLGPGAQLPPAAPLDPMNNPLDAVLLGWENEMMRVQTLAAQLERVEEDLAFKSKKMATGFAQYMRKGEKPGEKPVNLAMLDLRDKQNTKILVEKFICTGTYLYQYSPAKQAIRAFKMPEPPPGQVANDNFLAFLFGMKAQEAKRRYDLKLTKQDQYYYYIDVAPRLPEDKADFSRAQVVLNKGSFLPRMLWFENNGTTTTWDIPAIKSGVAVDPAGFDAPKPTKEWKIEEVPVEQQGQPKLLRGQ